MASALPSLALLLGAAVGLGSLIGCDAQRERPPRAEPAQAATAPSGAPEAQSAPAASTTPPLVLPVASVPPVTSNAGGPTLAASAAAPASAGASASPRTPTANVPCFCMSWVHRDENGEYCYPTRAACDDSFRTFGRHDKLPCRASMQPRCERIACRGGGAECFRLP